MLALAKDFQFTSHEFDFIRELVAKETGIALADAKREMVYGRLAKRLRQLGLPDFKSYIAILTSGDNEELTQFINAITTNLTAFFREDHHFEFLKKKLLPQLRNTNQGTRRIRIWSAGCSTGEEPYSLAMVCHEAFSDIRSWDFKILATDLDTNVLANAEEGVYTQERIAGLTRERIDRFFKVGTGAKNGQVKVRAELQNIITFKQLNLMEAWPIRGQFDFIFCRNVIIYFSKDTQRVLIDRYANHVVDNGHLFLGHSESLYKVSERFDILGQTIYQKKR